MTLYETLLEQYGYNEPILTNEIQFNNYSKPWIYKELNRLCDNNQVVRFEKGIYYIPKQTPFGASVLNPGKVIEKKYIKSRNETFGYYSGYYLLNLLGISNQVPNVIEVYSNNESSKMRDVKVGVQNVRVRRSRVNITKENAAVLTFLELMNIIDVNSLDAEKKRIIIEFIAESNVSRQDITKYSPAYPDRAMRAMIESEIIYSVAQ
ncbi:MAG: DUF6088 family protein [Coprococcus sp.]